MQQESIYSKLALNTSIAQRIEDNVRKNKPPEGLVQMLTITEKQYGRMELLVGEVTSEVNAESIYVKMDIKLLTMW